MIQSDAIADQVEARALEMFERHVRPRLSPADHGKLVVINMTTGEFEMGDDDLETLDTARKRFPDAELFTMRAGRPAAFRLDAMKDGFA